MKDAGSNCLQGTCGLEPGLAAREASELAPLT